MIFTPLISSIENKTEARPVIKTRVQKRDVANKRREFHRQSSIFQSILVDWEIPFDRLTFESKPLPGFFLLPITKKNNFN